jgi:NADP-dependent 3-hydroxy acid dehydrogenase YdfG
VTLFYFIVAIPNIILVVITGVSPKALASEADRAIAIQQPGLLVLAARSISLLEETRANILKSALWANLRLLQFDLGSQDSVRKATAIVGSYTQSFDIFINIAGVMATLYTKISDGIESQFRINHIGIYLSSTVSSVLYI